MARFFDWLRLLLCSIRFILEPLRLAVRMLFYHFTEIFDNNPDVAGR